MTLTVWQTRERLAGARRAIAAVVLAMAGVFAAVQPAAAQIDPLIALKRLPPNVVVVVDTSFRMLDDGDGNYYDPYTYNRADDTSAAAALGVSSAQYRRIYQSLLFEATQTPSNKYLTANIVAVQSSDAGYSRFYAPTRFEKARAGIAQAVSANARFARWGLMKLRQNADAWRVACDTTVHVTGNASLQISGDSCAGAVGLGLNLGAWGIFAPYVASANFAIETTSNDAVVLGVAANQATNMLNAVQASMGTGPLIPAGKDTSTYQDRPLSHALDDARAQVASVMAADSAVCACRNTVVVLITGGRDDGDPAYVDTHDPVGVAGTFAAVTAGGATRRVPIVVIGVKPNPADETELIGIAAASGGRYFGATSADDVAAAINYAVQLGYQKSADFDAMQKSDYTFVTPIVGTVNLVGASDVNGTPLADTNINSVAGPTTGQQLPQRGNFMLTAGFSLPGFDGRLRAFRAYKPVLDATKPTGWRFQQDGTRLWPDLDGRPHLAGLARTPASSDSRNIYTIIPDTGAGTVVAFTLDNAAMLAPHLGGADPAKLIPLIRSQAIGAVIGSTPALMDPPSLDPAPDADYGASDSTGTYAGNHKLRRSMIFFGANDGMIHAVDARTGYEVWAFIPYNLLPKLRALIDGQAVEQFDYFVDSSPKVAEVKIGGAWRTMLVIGQSYGGTFYQAFDVTEAGMGVSPTDDGLSAVSSLLARFDTPNESIAFSWAFPRYSQFDPDVFVTQTLTDGFPGGRLTMYGDLKASASPAEKRVGFSFSDPAVGALTNDRSVNAVITGSGYFPSIESALPGRSSPLVEAGHAFFVLNAETGLPVGNASGACSGTGCIDVGDKNDGRKNTIQADVTASADLNSHVVNKAYVGDTDGKYWRFAISSSGAISADMLYDTDQPIYSSSALLQIGSSQRYLFFGTGSDLLPASNPGGGSAGGTTFKLYGVKDGTNFGTVTVDRSLSPAVVSTALLTNGERPTAAPTVAGDIVFFTTTTDVATVNCGNATTKLYAFTYLGTAAYDSDGSGAISTGESPVVATAVGRGTAPFIVDQHLYLSTTSMTGAGVTALGDPQDFNNGVGQVGVKILSWREIR
ncbi:MAG TPA: hypothetical protein VFO19_15335 [Vicinamibacterales bacterium]|nr:hypothetical protein [Vicinamibacterales bacterium]